MAGCSHRNSQILLVYINIENRHVIESMCGGVCGKVHLQRPHIGVAAFQFYCCCTTNGLIDCAAKSKKDGKFRKDINIIQETVSQTMSFIIKRHSY